LKAQIRTHDKLRARELLDRHFGMWDASGLPDGPIDIQIRWPEQMGEWRAAHRRTLRRSGGGVRKYP
jgi:hypothetical protein